MISGTLEACGPSELTLLAVALIPLERLERLVEDVLREAEAAVRNQVRARAVGSETDVGVGG